MTSETIQRGFLRWAIKNFIFLLILAGVLFLSAGRWDWGMGWAYVGLVTIIQVLDAMLLDHELLAERSQLREGTKAWDRALAGFMALFGPLLTWVVAGLDERLGWSPDLPLALQLGMLAAAGLSALFTIWAMRANPFFSGTVRIQAERGHRVVTSGPYRLMRHPGYAGAILFDLATPLILDSLWALVPAALTVGVICLRTALEDRTLQSELDGYREYAGKVPYRLVPGLW